MPEKERGTLIKALEGSCTSWEVCTYLSYWTIRFESSPLVLDKIMPHLNGFTIVSIFTSHYHRIEFMNILLTR